MARLGLLSCALVLVASIGSGAWGAPAEPPKLKYFVVVRNCADPNGEENAFTAEVREQFIELLQRRPEIALERPSWLPEDAAAMKLEMARRGVRAYDAHIKVVGVQRHVGPSEIDPQKRALSVTLKLQLFGNNLPDRELKIGGSGEAQTSVLIGERADVEIVTKKVLHNLARAALEEAIKATIEKIEIVAQREKHP